MLDQQHQRTDEFSFDPACSHQSPQVLWAAPGSLHVDQLTEVWRRRGSLADLARITGPWAIVAWEPATRVHVVVVDPVGVQPLYWARTSDSRVAVSSWLERLLERPDVDDALDYEGVLLDSCPGVVGEEILDRTRYASVSRVPWGRALVVRSDGSARLQKYWDPRALPGPDHSLSLRDAAEMLRERIDAAIRRSMTGEVAVGGHVSGGLDCTAVTCRANQLLSASGSSIIAGYSWAPDNSEAPRIGDERSLIDEVARQESFPVRTVRRDESGDWYFDLDRDRYPQTAHARERFVLPQARNDGVRIMLSGWGGDELASFNGRGALRNLVRGGHVFAVWDQTSRRVKITGTTPAGFRQQARSFLATMLDASPEWFPDPRHRAERRQQRTNDDEIDIALRSMSPLAADTWCERRRTFQEASDHHDVQLALLTGGHLQRRCEGWYQTGRLFDVTYRYPLLDLDVVTAALRLPWPAFCSQGWTRTAFRLAIEPWVPSSVAWNISKSEPALFGPRTPDPVERPSW